MTNFTSSSVAAITRPLPPPLARPAGRSRHPRPASSSTSVSSGGYRRCTGRLGRFDGQLDLVATVEGGDDRLDITADAEIDARELGMSWSPVGNLRTPVALAVRACLRRLA